MTKNIDWLIQRMQLWGKQDAIIMEDSSFTYSDIVAEISKGHGYRLSSEVNIFWLYGLLSQDEPKVTITTSGTTGEPKSVTHYIADLAEQYREKVPTPYRMIAFLLFDHMGGINTLIRSLCSGGTLIIPKTNRVDDVCKVIEQQKATCLPTTPSFLNMLLMTEAYKHYDLSSLKVISFGTEVMPENIMDKLMRIFPDVRWAQTYGTTELGVLKVKTNKVNPLLIQVENSRVKNEVLQVRMYEPQPLGVECWVDTGDLVEEYPDGWIRIVGRKSDIINVGGEKVHPLELEELFLRMNEVDDVAVYGESNPIMGNVVCAKFNLNMEYTSNEWKKIVWERMNGLPKFWRPAKVIVTSEQLYGARGKKVRR